MPILYLVRFMSLQGKRIPARHSRVELLKNKKGLVWSPFFEASPLKITLLR